MNHHPTDEEIMIALCCGARCKLGPNTGRCHRYDFDSEVKKIRALLNDVAMRVMAGELESQDDVS